MIILLIWFIVFLVIAYIGSIVFILACFALYKFWGGKLSFIKWFKAMEWQRRNIFMFTIFMKDNSLIFQSGFETWGQAELYGWDMFGPGNFEIVQEWQIYTRK